MPNGFARSTAGEYTSNMFWIVGIALIASWVVAVVFTPYLGVKLLPDIKKVEGGHDAIYDTPRYNRFRKLLGRVIARKWLVAGVRWSACSSPPCSAWALVKKQFFPTSDRPEVLVEVQMPYGTSIEQTSAAAAKVEAWLPEQKEAKIVTSYIGQGAPRFYLAMAPELARSVVRQDRRAHRQPGGARGTEIPPASARSPMVWLPRRACASPSSSSAPIRLSRSPTASRGRIRTSCARSPPR